MDNFRPKRGKVYALLNRAMPYSIKIGLTGNDDLNVRQKALYKTGVPMPFTVFMEASVHDMETVENRIHKILHEYLYKEDREFFGFIPDPLDEGTVVSTIKNFKSLKNKVREIFEMLRASNSQNQRASRVAPSIVEKVDTVKGVCRKCGLACGIKLTLCLKANGCRTNEHNNCVSCGENSGAYLKCKLCKH